MDARSLVIDESEARLMLFIEREENAINVERYNYIMPSGYVLLDGYIVCMYAFENIIVQQYLCTSYSVHDFKTLLYVVLKWDSNT